MRIYTVHEPPAKRRETRRGPENFVFVRDGFYFWAFLLAPIWLAYRRLWLALLGYVLFMIVVGFALAYAGIAGAGASLIHFVLAVLIGLEAGTLWRWTLRRRGWRELGAVTARDLEAAEQRFFDAWNGEIAAVQRAPYPAYVPHAAMPAATAPTARESGVVGLFPEPGSSR